LVEVTGDDLKPKSEESSVGLLVVNEVVEREVKDGIEERTSGSRGRRRRKERDEIGEGNRCEGFAGDDERSVRGRCERGFGNEVECRREVRSRVVRKEESDEGGDIEVLYPIVRSRLVS
jgi:hypothetical protein